MAGNMLIWGMLSYVTTSPSPTSPTNLVTIHLCGICEYYSKFVDLALLQHYYAKVPGLDVLYRWKWKGYNQFRVEGGAVLDLGWQMLKRANDRSFDCQWDPP